MQEELNEFKMRDIWDLTPRTKKNIIGTKWILKNKLKDKYEVVRNKEILVAQGYSQQEGIDYTKTFAPVARSTNGILCQELSKFLPLEFEMSMMREIKSFLGIYIQQSEK
uniref:Uncharacterized protein LOC113784839 n=1 Tax=Cicer arietinum TaxID=3827 RepID=A0A3Q7YBV3_CICAR